MERMKAQMGGNWDESKHPRDEHGRWSFGKVGAAAVHAVKEFRSSLAGSTSPKQGELVATAMKGKKTAKLKEKEHMYNKHEPSKAEVVEPKKAPIIHHGKHLGKLAAEGVVEGAAAHVGYKLAKLAIKAAVKGI